MVQTLDSDGLIVPRLYIRKEDNGDTSIYAELEVSGEKQQVKIWPHTHT